MSGHVPQAGTLGDVAANRTSGHGPPPLLRDTLELVISSCPERDHGDTEMDTNTSVNDQQPKQEQGSCSDKTASMSLRGSVTGYSCQTSSPREAHNREEDQRILAHDFSLGFSSSSGETGLGLARSGLGPEDRKTQISRTVYYDCRTELQPPQETATEYPFPVDKLSPPLEDPKMCTSTVAHPDYHPGHPGHISLGNLTTNGLIENYPQKQHPEPISVPKPYSNKEGKATVLSQRLGEFKLETEFQGDYILQRVGTWESGSSTKRWRTFRWKKKAVIGSGSFGTVWLQQREGYGDENEKVGGGVRQLRAVKTVPRDLSQGASLPQELLAFVKLKQFGHLFVNFDGWYEDSDNMFLVMEYVQEGDLSQYILRSKEGSKGSRSLMEVKEITRQILEGLEVLHSKNIYHRDLKPQNILMASLDPVWIKIADFGVSKHAKNTSLRTRAGTQGYLAPEILGCNPRKFKTRSLIPHALDIWSLGCLVYELIAFEPPFLDQEPEEEDEPTTGVEAWPTSASREIDFASLREYCHYGLQFPVALLKQSDLAAGEGEEVFIRSLLVPNPMARMTASNTLQSPWLRGLGYTSGRTEFWRNEFLQLGVELDFGRDNIFMRQADVGDIYEFLPKECSVLDLLLAAARKNRNEALDRLLKSPSCLKSVDSAGRAKLFQEAIDARQRDVVQTLLQHESFFEACFGDKSVQEWAIGAAADDGEMSKLILEHTSDLWGGLLLAVKSGNIDIVQAVLERDSGKEVFGTGNPQLHIPLREAVEGGHLDIIKLLLDEDTNINMPEPNHAGGRTLLQIAVANGHVDVVKYLLQKGANVNGLPGENGGRIALQVAAGLGHVEIIDLLLRNDANVNCPAAITNGRTALQAAVEHQHIDAIKLLLDNGANVNGTAGAKSGKTALQAAARCGNLEIIKILLDSGADVDANGSSTGGGRALQMACTGGHLDIVKLLLSHGADIDSRAGRYGKTALQAAAEVGNMDILELLLGHKADVNAAAGGDTEDTRGTALQLAAGNGHFEMVKILIDTNAHVNAAAVGRFGKTALQAAAKGGHLGILELLLENGANPAALDNAHWTALSIAAGGGYIDIVQLLLESYECAKPHKTAALSAASGNGHTEIVKLLLYHGADVKDEVRLSSEAPPRISKGFGDGDSAYRALFHREVLDPSLLQEAAGGGNIDVVKALLDNGAAISATNSGGGGPNPPALTSLGAAARGGHITILKLLLDKGVDVGASGPSPYHLLQGLAAAAAGGHLEVVKLLLNRSSDASTSPSGSACAARRTSPDGFAFKPQNITGSTGTEPDENAARWCTSLAAASKAERFNVIGYLLGHAICTRVYAHESRFDPFHPHGIQALRMALGSCIKHGRLELLERILHLNNHEEICTEALQQAASVGNIGMVRLLLSTRGGAVVHVGADGLGAAAEGGNIKIFTLFWELYNQSRRPAAISFDDDTAQRDTALRTALKLATCGGHSAIVKLLLTYDGVDPASGLEHAAETGNVEIAKLLLERSTGPSTLWMTAPLCVAANHGHTGIVRLLLRHKADVNALTPGTHEQLMTPLQAACKGGHSEIVFLLLEKRPAIKQPHGSHTTALAHAARGGHTGVVKLLLFSGADVNGDGGGGRGGLFGSSSNVTNSGSLFGGGLFGSNATNSGGGLFGSNPTNSGGGLFGGNPTNSGGGLFGSGSTNSGGGLFGSNPTNSGGGLFGSGSNPTNSGGGLFGRPSPLPDAPELAVESGNLNIIRYLLKGYGSAAAGDHQTAERTMSYEDALAVAAAEGHTHIVKLLLDCGVDPNKRPGRHRTALRAAALEGHTAIVKLLLEKMTACLTEEILDGEEALLAAVWGGNINIIRLLLDRKVKVNSGTGSVTALHAAAEIGHLGILKLLINNKADVNAVTSDGTTVLNSVLKSQNSDAIKFLVNLKSNAYPVGFGDSLDRRSQY